MILKAVRMAIIWGIQARGKKAIMTTKGSNSP